MLAWFVVAAIIIVAAALNVAGILAGQISAFFAGEILVPSGDGIVATPPGEREAHQRLAECEARIVKLKEGRP